MRLILTEESVCLDTVDYIAEAVIAEKAIVLVLESDLIVLDSLQKPNEVPPTDELLIELSQLV